MGLFGSLFGSAGAKYSNTERQLSKIVIKQLVSRYKVRSIDDQKEEGLIEDAIIKRRGSDGRISLRQIYEALIKLKNQRKISDYDVKGVVRVFQDHFNS